MADKPAGATPPAPPAAAEPPKAPDPTDDLVERKHTLAIGRKKLAYTSKTGRIVLREEVVEDGKAVGFKPKASVFVTTYTLDGADARKRPVTFRMAGANAGRSIPPIRTFSGPTPLPSTSTSGKVSATRTTSPTRFCP